MALKRIFNITDAKARKCLKCHRKIDRNVLLDSKVYVCKCGCEAFVEVSGSRVTMTDMEWARYITERNKKKK